MDVIVNMHSLKRKTEKCTEAFSFYAAFRLQVPCGRATAQFWSSINIYGKNSLVPAVL